VTFSKGYREWELYKEWVGFNISNKFKINICSFYFKTLCIFKENRKVNKLDYFLKKPGPKKYLSLYFA
jgi:hypothetical protein